MHSRKSNLLEIQIAILVSLVLLLLCRRSTDSFKVGAVFIDRNRMLGITDVRVQGRVVELTLGRRQMEGDEPFEEATARQLRRDVKIVHKKGDLRGGNAKIYSLDSKPPIRPRGRWVQSHRRDSAVQAVWLRRAQLAPDHIFVAERRNCVEDSDEVRNNICLFDAISNKRTSVLFPELGSSGVAGFHQELPVAAGFPAVVRRAELVEK
jgi:hypothetical protein